MQNREEEMTVGARPVAVRILSDFVMETAEGETFSCTLPATLRSVYVKEGKIPDPTLYPNDIPTLPKGEVRFSTSFLLDEVSLHYRHTFLKISHVDCIAGIFLNGRCLGRVHNAYLEDFYDVTSFLQPGENRLTVVFPSNAENEEYGDFTYYRRPLFDSAYGRDVGILAPVELHFTDCAVITDVSVRQEHSGGYADCAISVSLRGDTDGVRTVASLVSPTGRAYYFCLVQNGAFWEGNVTVDAPEYWFPNGFGPQSLYKLTVSLYCGSVQVDSLEKHVGLRDLVFSNPGDPLSVMVNKQSLLLIGAAYYPQNALLARTDSAAVEKMISAAATAHINFLRPVGSAGYADETFYSLCDRYGILVFQDFPIPNFPLYREKRLELLSSEVKRILPRLTLHASFAAFSFPSDAPRSREDILTMFENAFPDIGILDFSQLTDDIHGDYVSSDPADISLPIRETLDRLLPEDEKNVFSPSVEKMCPSAAEFGKALVSLSEKFRCPSDFYTFAHLFDLSQGQNLQHLIEQLRSPSSTRLARMLLLRRLNDTASAVSPSLIDCFGREKPALYMARKFFSPLYAFVHEEGNRAVVTVSSVGAEDFSGIVSAVLLNEAGNTLLKKDASASVLSGTSQNALEFDLSEFCHSVGKEKLRLSYRLIQDGGMVFRADHFMSRQKERNPAPMDLSATVKGIGQNFEITLSSSVCMEGLMLSLRDIPCRFSENCISLYGTAPVKITCQTAEKTVSNAVAEHLQVLGPQAVRLFTAT